MGHANALSEPGKAINSPDEYAWMLFTHLNKEAKGNARATVWETWIEQEDIYADPTKAPKWNTKRQLKKNFNQHIHNMLLQNNRLPNDVFHGSPAPFVADAIQEVRVNKAAFNYIVDKELWYQEGLLKSAMLNQVKFPIQSKVIKTTWVAIEEKDKPRYYWQMNGKQLVGMVAWGVMTKDLPMWYWATFEHVDNTGRSDITGSFDSFGATPAYQAPNKLLNQGYPSGELTPEVIKLFQQQGLAKVWQNYRLKGTQTSFTDSTGRAIIVGNSVQEAGQINTSSCMTCHARSSVAEGVKLAIPPKPGLAPNQFPNPFKSAKPALGFVGTPDPQWFYQAHSRGPEGAYQLLYPVDFLWQLPLLTKQRTGFKASTEAGE